MVRSILCAAVGVPIKHLRSDLGSVASLLTIPITQTLICDVIGTLRFARFAVVLVGRTNGCTLLLTSMNIT